jgi:hypothetical protein
VIESGNDALASEITLLESGVPAKAVGSGESRKITGAVEGQGACLDITPAITRSLSGRTVIVGPIWARKWDSIQPSAGEGLPHNAGKNNNKASVSHLDLDSRPTRI